MDFADLHQGTVQSLEHTSSPHGVLHDLVLEYERPLTRNLQWSFSALECFDSRAQRVYFGSPFPFYPRLLVRYSEKCPLRHAEQTHRGKTKRNLQMRRLSKTSACSTHRYPAVLIMLPLYHDLLTVRVLFAQAFHLQIYVGLRMR